MGLYFSSCKTNLIVLVTLCRMGNDCVGIVFVFAYLTQSFKLKLSDH